MVASFAASAVATGVKRAANVASADCAEWGEAPWFPASATAPRWGGHGAPPRRAAARVAPADDQSQQLIPKLLTLRLPAESTSQKSPPNAVAPDGGPSISKRRSRSPG